MNDNELKHLSRKELLEMLLMQSKKIDKLQARLDETTDELERKRISLSTAGSLADASARVSKFFEIVQSTADVYLDNVRAMTGHLDDEENKEAGLPTADDIAEIIGSIGELEITPAPEKPAAEENEREKEVIDSIVDNDAQTKPVTEKKPENREMKFEKAGIVVSRTSKKQPQQLSGRQKMIRDKKNALLAKKAQG